MKIKELYLRNYKKFISEKSIDFYNPEDGAINDMVLILGKNGSGKSSILQAIVALIAPLTRQNFKASDIKWSGFEYRLIQSGRLPVLISAKVEFTQEEIEETRRLAQELKDKGKEITLPGKSDMVPISFDYEQERATTKYPVQAYQFSGSQYARQLAAYTPNKSALFENVGNIYWYTEQRNSFDINALFDENKEQNNLDSIRAFLASAYSFHLAVERGRTLQTGQFDFYAKLETIYRKVFPDRKFVGTAPNFDLMEKTKAPDFFLSDGGGSEYELSEMSAGEKAIFPILMDFAQYNINNSIIIIDEIELHLHAPLQQGLIRVLPELGHNNQFIITSHSDSVVTMFSENQIIRLS